MRGETQLLAIRLLLGRPCRRMRLSSDDAGMALSWADENNSGSAMFMAGGLRCQMPGNEVPVQSPPLVGQTFHEP